MKKIYKCPEDCGRGCELVLEAQDLGKQQGFECPLGRGFMYGWREDQPAGSSESEECKFETYEACLVQHGDDKQKRLRVE